MRIALASLALLALCIVGVIWAVQSRAEQQNQVKWNRAVAQYRVRYPQGTTRKQIETDMLKQGHDWQAFSGGETRPDESPFKGQIILGTEANHLCGTTVYAYAVFVFRRDPSKQVLTDGPDDLIKGISLEEVDSCGAI